MKYYDNTGYDPFKAAKKVINFLYPLRFGTVRKGKHTVKFSRYCIGNWLNFNDCMKYRNVNIEYVLDDIIDEIACDFRLSADDVAQLEVIRHNALETLKKAYVDLV